jgi:hypothetical protein
VEAGVSTWDDWDGTAVICYACGSSGCEHADDPDSAEQVWGIELVQSLRRRFRVIAPTPEDAAEAAVEWWEEWWDPFLDVDPEFEVTAWVRLRPQAEEP